jgi:hypothetical protein
MIIKIYSNTLIMLSTILDISSFFIGMLINLLLIALICYYFKRKYESLELAQNEQAKILYNLIQSQTPRKQFDIADIMKTNFISNTVEKTQCVIEEDSDSDSDSDSESDDDTENESDNVSNVKVFKLKETEVVELDEDEDPPFVVTKVVEDPHTNNADMVNVDSTTLESTNLDSTVASSEVDYSKMTIKELKDILTKKGISSSNRMKKNELIQLIEVGVSDVLNLSDELSEVNI